MHDKSRWTIDKKQKPTVNNKTRDAAKVGFEMGALEHP